MNKFQRHFARKLAEKLIPAEELTKINAMPFHDMGYGYDQFGYEKESAILAYTLLQSVYKYYFRVVSQGHDNIPLSGRALLVPNHSGVLPLDATMIGVDLIKKMKRPRMMRAVTDNFMGFLPFINTLLYR